MLSYTRSDGTSVSESVIANLTDALSHAQEVPSFQLLRVQPATTKRLMHDVRHNCGKTLNEREALRRYFSIHVLVTDDYPDEVVTINFAGEPLRLESTAQQLYGLPWHVSGMWPQFDDYDPALSLAIAAISDAKADPNYDRLINAREWEGQFESIFSGNVCSNRALL